MSCQRAVVNHRLDKLHQKYGADHQDFSVTFAYKGSGVKEKTILNISVNLIVLHSKVSVMVSS